MSKPEFQLNRSFQFPCQNSKTKNKQSHSISLLPVTTQSEQEADTFECLPGLLFIYQKLSTEIFPNEPRCISAIGENESASRFIDGGRRRTNERERLGDRNAAVTSWAGDIVITAPRSGAIQSFVFVSFERKKKMNRKAQCRSFRVNLRCQQKKSE